MGPADWIALGFLLALGAAAAVLWRAWERPRVLVVIGLLVVVGVGMGALFGLILAGIASISSAALWFVLLAVIAFELYRWRRRRPRT